MQGYVERDIYEISRKKWKIKIFCLTHLSQTNWSMHTSMWSMYVIRTYKVNMFHNTCSHCMYTVQIFYLADGHTYKSNENNIWWRFAIFAYKVMHCLNVKRCIFLCLFLRYVETVHCKKKAYRNPCWQQWYGANIVRVGKFRPSRRPALPPVAQSGFRHDVLQYMRNYKAILDYNCQILDVKTVKYRGDHC